MSLSGALSSAISALSAQSQSLAMVSDNIANADTTGYKTNSAMFADMVTNSSSAQQYSSGGVSVASRANITQQGLLATTTNATDVAIQGNGFFAVTTATTGGTTLYTRDGAFTTDKDGYLENNGYYLQGYQLDATGKTISGLEPIKTTSRRSGGRRGWRQRPISSMSLAAKRRPGFWANDERCGVRGFHRPAGRGHVAMAGIAAFGRNATARILG